MANIEPYTNQISTARYGNQVRSSIVNALTAMNADINNDTASARSYANAASANATTCQSISDNLQSVIQSVEQTEATIEAAETQRQEAEATRQATETGYVAQCRNYAERAENAVLRYGVTQFNGRTGAVRPVTGDYSSDMITHGVGGSVSGKFDSVDSAIAANAEMIEENADAIASNVDAIASNASAISTLQSQMSSSTTITTADATAGTATSVAKANIAQCRLLKIGKLVFCNLSMQSNGTDFFPNNTTLFTIPEGYRPAINNLPGGVGYDSSNVFHVTRFRVNADGVINYADYNNMKVLQLSFFWKIP